MILEVPTNKTILLKTFHSQINLIYRTSREIRVAHRQEVKKTSSLERIQVNNFYQIMVIKDLNLVRELQILYK